MGWKDLLAEATIDHTLERARSCLGRNTEYVLGAGGMRPDQPFTSTCDCSGFVAWAIGIPRELPPGSQKWLSTDEYWAGGGPVGEGLFDRVTVADAEPGDLYVYPDSGGHQGHIGIITAVEAGKPSRVVHCSKGNWTREHDAVQETGPSVFATNPLGRIVRVDYEALRALFGIAATDPGNRPKRLILAKWVGGPPDPYGYKYFPEGVFREDHFEIPPNVVAAWLGRSDDRTQLMPVQDLLREMGFVPNVNAEHIADAIDPRVYVFLPPIEGGAAVVASPTTETDLRSPFLKSDSVLAKVAAGEIVLRAADIAQAGVGALQDGINHLAQAYKDLFIDTHGGKYRGFYGARTVKAVKAFQSTHGIEANGTVGGQTLRALDAALMSFDANGMVDKTRTPTPGGQRPSLGDFRTEFIHAAAEPARASMRATRVPASVTIAQAILESNWGRSGLSKQANNYFGIKGTGPAGVYEVPTKEFVDGKWVVVTAKFRRYHSMEESFVDHGELIANAKRNGKLVYAAAMAHTDDARAFARGLQGVYATDPNYAKMLISIIDQYDLDLYDS